MKTLKTWQQVSKQDLLTFTDLAVYIRGISARKLQDMRNAGRLPSQILPGLWSKYHIDRWLAKPEYPYDEEVTDLPEMGKTALRLERALSV